MEAVSEPQHRTKVNLSAGCLAWVSARLSTMPSIRSWPFSIRGGSGGTLLILTPRDLDRSTISPRPKACGRGREGNDNASTSVEKSDHLIVVLNPGNAGGLIVPHKRRRKKNQESGPKAFHAVDMSCVRWSPIQRVCGPGLVFFRMT